MLVAGWLVLAYACRLVLGSSKEWDWLKKELNDSVGGFAPATIAEKWSTRPADFFKGISQGSWERLISFLSSENMAEIRAKEFEKNLSACRAFARHLPKLSQKESLPKLFRLSVYKLLEQNEDTIAGQLVKATVHRWASNYLPQVASLLDVSTAIAKAIPISWIVKDGKLIIKSLVKAEFPKLGLLGPDPLAVLLNNHDNACEFITLGALKSLNWRDLILVSPKCINAIRELGKMDLSGILEYLRKDAFAEYNGPLSKQTIKKLSLEQVENYGSLIKDAPICTFLDLHYLGFAAAAGLSSECLYGYLGRQQKRIGLGELWNAIPIRQIERLAKGMEPFLSDIPLQDFARMRNGPLEVILNKQKFCPTIDVLFWTKEMFRYISSQCLYKILAQNQAPVRLGKLWSTVNRPAVHKFTDEMRLTWVKIDRGDFDFMQPDLLMEIPSYPRLCSALGLSFWIGKMIKHISGECLHALLATHGAPVKLGSLWGQISKMSFLTFLSITHSLELVHPDDRPLAEYHIFDHVNKGWPGFCSALDSSFWTRETVKYMSLVCLESAIYKPVKPVALGQLWEHIPARTIRGVDDWTLGYFKNVVGSDFQYMPLYILNKLFSSDWDKYDQLPVPSTNVFLSPKAEGLSMGPKRFAKLIKWAPSIAGQILWYSKKLSKDILSYCDGNNIRSLSLAIPGEEELDWKGLFARLQSKYSLEGRAEFFDQMVQSISENASSLHFCATLLDLDEYLSLAWIHHNWSGKCRLALFFDPDHVSRLFEAMDLFQEQCDWPKMLEIYRNDDWALLSRSKRVAALLGKDCGFWSVIESENRSSVFKALHVTMLKSITPECVSRIPRTLASNPDKIPLLADDAFSKHVAGQLPCRLQDLTPEQISQVSKQATRDHGESTINNFSLHVLSGATLDDLVTLNLQQFSSLYKSQWGFIPGSITNEALVLQFKTAQFQLSTAATKLDSKHHNYNEQNDNDWIGDFRTTKAALELVLQMYKNEYLSISEFDLVPLIDSIKSSSHPEAFIKIFKESTILAPVTISLVRDGKELREYNQTAFKEIVPNETKLALLHDQQTGFDRSGIIELLEKTPELFAAPDARVNSQGITDNGRAIRSLTNQLLADIERDLCTRAVTLELEFAEKARIEDDPPRSSFRAVDDHHNGNSKFVWGISKEMGLIVGLAFGKALQLDMKLPFALGQMFYGLLIDTSDKAIRQYYLEMYSLEIALFKQDIIDYFGMEDSKESLITTFKGRPGFRFAQLSTGANHGKANLQSYSDKDCYQNVSSVENYINTILEKIRQEFKEFIRELVRGLGMALPPVRKFKSLPLPLLYPFAKFLPQLLNAEPILVDQITKKISMAGMDYYLEFAEKWLTTSMVLLAFIRSLDENQLSHLLGVWTGSTTISLEHIKLNVMSMKPDHQVSHVKFDFYNFYSASKTDNRPPVASSTEYRTLFAKFIKRLLGEGAAHKLSGGLEFYPTKISTCGQHLVLYVQSLQQTFSSLVDLLNTPLTDIKRIVKPVH